MEQSQKKGVCLPGRRRQAKVRHVRGSPHTQNVIYLNAPQICRELQTKNFQSVFILSVRNGKKATTIAKASNADNICSCLVHPTFRMLIFIVKQTTGRFFSPFSSPFRRYLFFFISLIYPFAKLYKFVCGDLVVRSFLLFLRFSKMKD